MAWRPLPGGPAAPVRLGDTLDGVLARLGTPSRAGVEVVFERWDEVVGAELAQHCRPVRLAGGVLTVAASSPQWATQLRYLTHQLQLNVNAAMGEPVVTSVNVVVGRPGDGDG